MFLVFVTFRSISLYLKTALFCFEYATMLNLSESDLKFTLTSLLRIKISIFQNKRREFLLSFFLKTSNLTAKKLEILLGKEKRPNLSSNFPKSILSVKDGLSKEVEVMQAIDFGHWDTASVAARNVCKQKIQLILEMQLVAYSRFCINLWPFVR